jgi:hypothetical protein
MQQGLIPSQKLVLLSLADRANEQHICWPSIYRLAIDTGLDERTIYRTIKSLTDKGILSVSVITVNSSTGPKIRNSYRLIGVDGREGTPYKLTPLTICHPCQNVTPDNLSPLTECRNTPDKMSPRPLTQCQTQHTNEPKEEPSKNPPQRACAREGGDDFSGFLNAYPGHKRDQGATFAQWRILRKSGSLPDLPLLLSAIAAWRASEQWQKDNGQYVPLASNFLAKRKWLDTPVAASQITHEAPAKPSAIEQKIQREKLVHAENSEKLKPLFSAFAARFPDNLPDGLKGMAFGLWSFLHSRNKAPMPSDVPDGYPFGIMDFMREYNEGGFLCHALSA